MTPTPAFIHTPSPDRSFRSIFKWGDDAKYKDPSPGFLRVIRETLGPIPEAPERLGNRVVPDDTPCRLSRADMAALAGIVGDGNISVTTYDRLKFASGKAMEDIFRLRNETVTEIGDAVLHPRDKADVREIVAYCHAKRIPVHVYGGGSSVTFGLDCPKGGVTLVMATHMNRLIRFDETNQTITVEPGMSGPDYEALLNEAPDRLNAGKRYTGGHFPQSFEHSSVGGWVVTLGSGQASSLYGDAGDLVISQEYVTPAGSFTTLDYPATATGPRVNDIMKGSEGCFGILVSVTMKVFEYLPRTRQPFSFMFPDFESAVRATRDISQGQFGMPAILRVSDPEETDVAMQMYGLEGGVLDRFLRFRGLEPGRRCLVMGQAEGEKGFAAHVKRRVRKVCRGHGGVYLTGFPMKKWYRGRFSDPYMRDALNDFGVLIDTLETSVTWSAIHDVYDRVRAHIKARPKTICMTHASHFYAQGTNLYFIFITPMGDVDEFRAFQQSVIDCIEKSGGSLSHHHGVGRMMAPWMDAHLGEVQMGVLRAVKSHLDPGGIMNPGGLGL